jgi:hypothetical protein
MQNQERHVKDIDSGAVVLCANSASVSLPTMITLRPRCSALALEENETEDTSAKRHD